MSGGRTNADSYVLFELAGVTYGIRSLDVRRVEMVRQITRVPNTSNVVDGVVLSRGEIIPAINLRVIFGFEKIAYDGRTRLIVANINDRTVGLIVDSARDFKHIPEESIIPPPREFTSTNGDYLAGIAKVDDNRILLLDLNELVGETSIQQG
jgi:purine-binding chemotaxis protein CheW